VEQGELNQTQGKGLVNRWIGGLCDRRSSDCSKWNRFRMCLYSCNL